MVTLHPGMFPFMFMWYCRITFHFIIATTDLLYLKMCFQLKTNVTNLSKCWFGTKLKKGINVVYVRISAHQILLVLILISIFFVLCCAENTESPTRSTSRSSDMVM